MTLIDSQLLKVCQWDNFSLFIEKYSKLSSVLCPLYIIFVIRNKNIKVIQSLYSFIFKKILSAFPSNAFKNKLFVLIECHPVVLFFDSNPILLHIWGCVAQNLLNLSSISVSGYNSSYWPISMKHFLL